MGKKGRPVTRPAELRDGFYLELKTKGSSIGIKIRRESKEEIDEAIEQYGKSKIVNYLGQVKDGRWMDGKNKGKKTVWFMR